MVRGRFSMALVAALLVTILIGAPRSADAGSIFLTGHDPDFHASLGGNTTGSININNIAIGYIMDPAFNPFSGLPFIFVESNILTPNGHTIGENGIIASGYTAGVDYVNHDASTLNAALDGLGTVYGGIVIASDFGGLLTQAELDILNARSADIINFLNSGGGLYAMAESGLGAGLTTSGWFGYLPFIVSSSALNQSEVGNTVTPFGTSLGLVNGDVNGNASHNVFLSASGMGIVDLDASGRILTLAVRAQVTPGGVPEPATVLLMGTALAGFLASRRRSKRST